MFYRCVVDICTDRKPVDAPYTNSTSHVYPTQHFGSLKSYDTRNISKIIVRVSYDVHASPLGAPCEVLHTSYGISRLPSDCRAASCGLHTGTLRLEPTILERALHGPRQICDCYTGMPQNPAMPPISRNRGNTQ
jgi:hypothetical protein